MKNIIIILIGIIIGSGSTLLIQQAKPRPKVSVIHEYKGIDFGGMKVTDLSTDNLHIFDSEVGILTVSPKKNPDMYVFFEMLDGENLTISLHDANDTTASFNDKNSDGKWDFRDFHNNGDSYLYGRGTGYPDTIMTSNDSLLVRFDENYYKVEGEPGSQYIIKNGHELTIQPNPEGLGYFTIKATEQIK